MLVFIHKFLILFHVVYDKLLLKDPPGNFLLSLFIVVYFFFPGETEKKIPSLIL